METISSTTDIFNKPTTTVAKAEEFFLPSMIGVVKHLARMAAEQDYKLFLATGKLPYADCDDQEVGND